MVLQWGFIKKKGKVVDVNNALNGDGPFTTNRAGSIDATNIIDLCFSGKYTKDDLYNLITKKRRPCFVIRN